MGTSAAEFLLDELRHIRLSAKLNQDDFGKLINFSGSHVSAVELGNRPPKEDYLGAIDKRFHTGAMFVRLLKKVIKSDTAAPWLKEWVANEQRAIFLRWFELAFVPGLLQTEAYARAIVSSDGRLTDEAVEARVMARAERQRRLSGDDPPQFMAVLDEAVLHRAVGGPAVMREQLFHLVRLNEERRRTRIHIVPSSVGAYAGLTGPFIIATLPEREEVLYLEDRLRGQVVARPDDVAEVREHWEDILAEALTLPQSTELIAKVAKTWI
ncbi:helix-turn-helix domain-containing protein [Plantactinospora alkalitolerans]|uniref:helix-turn-helix domain-containing protein n=1 Tax=Plantactinospora alkalitolerans TaxID=2789879 RepID=UPI001E3DD539|nr:helix-turn-helix transcriptional regulator [Plantactinospora alkalitolerans]